MSVRSYKRLLRIFAFAAALVGVSTRFWAPDAGAADPSPATDRTLVAWAAPAPLDQRGGSVLTLQAGDVFDAIVFGEREPRRWMLGSDRFRRTQADQAANAVESNESPSFVQIAIVTSGEQVLMYRDGELYATYAAEPVDLMSDPGRCVVFGLRHIGAATGTPFAGLVDDARIYDRALSREEIRALAPNTPSTPEPVAWWDFNDPEVRDRRGLFPHHAVSGKVATADGRLVLDGSGYLVAARTAADAALATRADHPRPPAGPFVPETPHWPERPPAGWLTFHLAHPGPGRAVPGDPNCIFDHGGRVHLHYIYAARQGFAFAHVSSDDMVHWKWHPTVLAPPTTGHGMFSGTGFFDKDGRPVIIYHGQGADRNVLQRPLDDTFDSWSEPVAVVPRDAAGTPVKIRNWDPDCWLMDGRYYAYSGGNDPPLMRSDDLVNWEYLGPLLHPEYRNDLGVPRGEDISCGNMFRLGDKWMLLCISHGRGCRYYLGDFVDGKYRPDSHAMMSFGGNQFFAPESVLTRDGRRVMWAWLMNLPIQPTGVQSLPRELELPADGVLRIRPLRELASLRLEPRTRPAFTVRAGETVAVPEAEGDAVELLLTVAAPLPPEFTVDLLSDAAGNGGMTIVAGEGRATLGVGTTEAPFRTAKGEDLTLRVFIDKNLVEVFANDRQAAVFAVPNARAEPRISLRAHGGDAQIKNLTAWKLRSIFPGFPGPAEH
jgi:sucrose-6-phosphate hydrolase SacC (GH32 family)